MTGNLIDGWGQLLWILAGTFLLAGLSLALALPRGGGRKPASRGHRPEADESGQEDIRPDGYIDSFANEVEEAGGSVPPALKIAIPLILLWWLGYLLMFWSTGSGG